MPENPLKKAKCPNSPAHDQLPIVKSKSAEVPTSAAMDTEAPQNKDFENQSKAPVSPQEDADDVNSAPISTKKDSDTLVNVSVKKVPDKKDSATASVDKVSPKADSGSTNNPAVDPVPLQKHTNIPTSAPGNKATDSSQQLVSHGIAKAVKSREFSVEGTPASVNAPPKSP